MDEKKPSTGKVIQSIILFILYVVVFGFLIRYVASNADMMEKIANAPKGLVAVGLITTAVGLTVSAFLDITCAKVYGMKLGAKDAVVFTFVSTAINLVIPLQMGSVIKAIYYKRKMGLSYSRYLSIISGTVIIRLIVIFVILIVSLFFTVLGWGIEKKYLILVSIAFLLGLAAMYGILRFQDRILQILPLKKYTVPVMAGFFEIFNNKRAMLLCSLNYLFTMVLGGIRFATIILCLGIPAGIGHGMLYYGLYSASSALPILPGNIGISEAIVGVMNMILGADFEAGVTIVLINRIYYYLIALSGAVISAIPAWIMFRSRTDEK